MEDVQGTIYLICFDESYPRGGKNPRGRARHYMGWASDLDSRIDTHRSGDGSCLMRAVVGAGIGFRVVKTWSGTRSDERTLKNKKNAPRLCPACSERSHGAVRG